MAVKKTTSKKKAEPKKTASKKKPAAKKTAASKGRNVQLVKQLTSIIKDLNEEGLLFLLRQAQVLQYNENVEAVNKSKKKRKGKEPPESFEIPKPERSAVEIIENEESGNFIIVIGGYRKFFTLEEMRKIVKICNSADGSDDASARLYNWLSKNRGDVISDAEIPGKSDPALESIYKYIVKTYTVKD